MYDPLSTTMSLMVTIVSFVVLIFSYSYMAEDPHFIRFMGYMHFFIGFMLLFITAGNLIQLFFG